MQTLALDVATETGCCDGAVNEISRQWTWYLKDHGDSRPRRLLMLHKFLCYYFQKQQLCELVVYEAPIPHGAKVAMSEETNAFLRGAIGVVEMTCAAHNKPVKALNVQDARESVLGWRTNRSDTQILRSGMRRKILRAETTKDRVMREVKMLGIECANEHEADAWVLWRAACNRQNQKLAIASHNETSHLTR